jgi:hypothetical protein
MVQDRDSSELCGVCGEPLDDANVSRCLVCGMKFHMAWSIDASVENCGHIWVEPMSSGIGFICNSCIDEHPELKGMVIQPEPPPA